MFCIIKNKCEKRRVKVCRFCETIETGKTDEKQENVDERSGFFYNINNCG